VVANELNCRASNIDIIFHSCKLTFDDQKIELKGRLAHELFATLAEVGVEAEGAAGSIFRSISNLKCTITAEEVAENSGGGAVCEYDQ
jgi:hypothetical protein